MQQIEVGDIVKVIDVGDNGEYYSEGDTGTVLSVERDNTILISFEEDENWWAEPSQLALVQRP